MTDYDFRCLSDNEFEDLVKDLCQAHFKIILQTYERGRDKGIDCRYLSPMPELATLARVELPTIDERKNQLVVQCKHYFKSGFRKLYRDIQNSELKKIEQLKPENYILATTVEINPDGEEKLENLISTICPRLEIWGRKAVNNLLGQNPEIERSHFKLWLTSTPVLERILHGRIFSQSDLETEEIQLKVSRYVHIPAFARALNVIEEHNYCIIAGIPGIGKTTLAQVLASHYVCQDYQIIAGSAGVDDALEAYRTGKKQLFLLDDFLGQNILELRLERNEDSRLMQLIRSVSRSKDKILIMTTREYVLNAVKAKSEKISTSAFDVRRVTVTLDDYGRRQRAKILYNHLFFSDLPKEHLVSLSKSRKYINIIDHPNFSPRVIEWMTERLNAGAFKSHEYVGKFLENLSDPTLLWNHVFENQLTEIGQSLFLIMSLSKGGHIALEDLKKAVRHYLRYLYPNSPESSISNQEIEKSLKILDGSVIHTSNHQGVLFVKFHNPSVRDFALARLRTADDTLVHLMQSLPFFDMLEFIWRFVEFNPQGKVSKQTLKREQFLNRLIDTFFSESCECSETSGMHVFRNQYPDLLQRARFLFSVSDALGNRDVELTKLVNSLSGRFSGHTEKSDLVRLVETVRKSTLVSERVKQSFFETALEAAIETFGSIDDMLIVFSFLEDNEEYLENQFGTSLAELYRKNINGIIDSTTGDSTTVDEVETEIDNLESLGKWYSLDISSAKTALEEKKLELEMEVDMADYDGMDDYRDYRDREDSHISDKAIEVMFDSLVDD